jgi:hypothetical protein
MKVYNIALPESPVWQAAREKLESLCQEALQEVENFEEAWDIYLITPSKSPVEQTALEVALQKAETFEEALKVRESTFPESPLEHAAIRRVAEFFIISE